MAGDRHWTLEDIRWDEFDPRKVDRETLKAIKAAALVEFNAPDYVTYLGRVFGEDPAFMADIERWGKEEVQHGVALAAWAKRADPAFDFDRAIARFRAGYRIPLDVLGSVRGSRAGEMIARCVVESGTSSYYSAIRDATEEPVLRQIAALIAADEFRHYRLFYEGYLRCQPVEKRGFLDRFRVALGRVQETEDDELAFAYYCANVADTGEPYDRARHSRAYNRRILGFYRPQHVRKGVGMIAKAVGLHPQGRTAKVASNLLWWIIQARGRLPEAT